MVHLTVERFIGVMVDYSIVYLVECAQCGVLIAQQGQGHNCGSILDNTKLKQWEAAHLANFMKGLKKVYVMKDFGAENL
jgi:hypothetical protein